MKGTVPMLIHTIKTTKPAGEVKFHPVHASRRHSFRGLTRWVSTVLRDGLRAYTHFVGSTDMFIKTVRKFEVLPDDIFVHPDLKYFYMNGSPEHLARYSSFVVGPWLRKLYIEVNTSLFNSQYIRSRLLGNRTWLVNAGSGIGCVMSGGLADAACLGFAHIGGKQFFQMKIHAVASEFSISLVLSITCV